MHYPTNLTVLVVYVPISSLLGASFLQSGSWNTNLQTLTGMMFTLAHVSNLVLISFVVWLQSVCKIGNKMTRCGNLGISLCVCVCVVFSLGDRMIHCWRSDYLTGHIWNILVCKLPLLGADAPWVF